MSDRNSSDEHKKANTSKEQKYNEYEEDDIKRNKKSSKRGKKKVEEEINFFSEEINEIKKHSQFFKNKGYTLTDEACFRLAKLLYYININNQVPILLEGPTGTSNTSNRIIANLYFKLKKEFEKQNKTKDENNEDELLNLNADTEIDDLLIEYIDDKNSASDLKKEEGLFDKGNTKERKIVLDEISLPPKEVLEQIQQAIDSGELKAVEEC